jgi:hypothetical protein
MRNSYTEASKHISVEHENILVFRDILRRNNKVRGANLTQQILNVLYMLVKLL